MKKINDKNAKRFNDPSVIEIVKNEDEREDGNNMDSVKKFRQRRDARLKKRMDEEVWKTINGTHVMVDEEGNITKGPEELKKAAKGKVIKGAPMFNNPKDSNAARKRVQDKEQNNAVSNKWDRRAYKKYMKQMKESEPDAEREKMKKGLRDEIKDAEEIISAEKMADFMDWQQYYKQKDKIEGAKREIAE